MIKYRIKNLAQLLPRSSEKITPGDYEYLDSGVIEYQKKLNNLIEVEISSELDNSQKSFVLELKVEDIDKPKRKTRRNIKNDTSN